MSIVIALLGAESTGKSVLALELHQRLVAADIDARLVPEYLREFCEQLGRTPRPDEQAGIAAEQTRRIEQAARETGVVIADTTALMPAIYSELLFGDTSLYADALAAQGRCDLTLVTGLDLPWQADGHIRDGAHVREPVDAMLRTRLQQAGVGYGVVYGKGTARVEAAWRSIAPLLARRGLVPVTSDAAEAEGSPARLRPWCRECLVPECEHLLFKRS